MFSLTIYKIFNKNDHDESYLGWTQVVDKILGIHRVSSRAKSNSHWKEKKLYDYVNDNGGWDNFEVAALETLYTTDKPTRFKCEEYWRDKLKPTLNL